MYTEEQLTKLIEDVEKEFTSHLVKAEEAALAPLAKAEEGDKKPEKKPEAKEDKAPEAKPEAEGKPEAEAKPEAAPAEAKAAEAAPAAAHDYDDEDLEHLHKMYMSMSEGERKVHHDAIMKCAMAKCGDVESSAPHGAEGEQSPDSHSHPDVQKSELNAHPDNAPSPKDNAKSLDGDPANGGIEGQEPSNSPGAKSPASNANGAKINKSEHDRRNGGKIETQEPSNSPGAKSPASKEQGCATDMEKSEKSTETELLKSELSTVNAKYDELKKTFDGVAAFLTKLVEKKPAPAAKAITSLDVIAKSESTGEGEPLQKAEIDSKLLAKSQDPKTSKSDREAINAFYLGNNDIKGISHLLK
jgi:hypothetical protein